MTDKWESKSAPRWSRLYESGRVTRDGRVVALSDTGWLAVEGALGRRFGLDAGAVAKRTSDGVIVDVTTATGEEISVRFRR